jgi:CxxC motif-containing protein
MEEIKVGEYIRTPYNQIEKVIRIDEERTDYVGVETDLSYYNLDWLKARKVKHSFDIKDLVQAGDIVLYNVNSKMTDIGIVKEHIDARTQEKTLRVGIWSLEQVEIKEILTKEQFNQMKYIVGDE